MPTKNENLELPKIVRRISDAVDKQLNRPSHCRKAMNQDEWFICDPVLSFIQYGMKKGATGYRVGYKYNIGEKELWFVLIHSPLISKLFKHNLVYSTLREILIATAQYRKVHVLWNSSKSAASSGLKNGIARSVSKDLESFVEDLDLFNEQFDFVKDLFFKPPNTGKGLGKAPVAGNYFCMKITDKSSTLKEQQYIDAVIEKTWPLFLCMYPVAPLEKRTAGLARAMKARGILKCCEFNSIELPLNSEISPLCRGSIQGAHIKPDALGGSDRPENGMWLCEFHHRITEGKLKGQRTDEELLVQYVGLI